MTSVARAIGKVRLINDNKFAWFIYDANMDRAFPGLFKDYNEFYNKAWMQDDGYSNRYSSDCKCKDTEEVEIYESYGGGMLWRGRACRHCMLITKNLESDDYTATLSHEDFKQWLSMSKFPSWCNTGTEG